MIKKCYIIISASSDIGCALAERLINEEAEVIGTYRTYHSNLKHLEQLGVKLHAWDASTAMTEKFYQWLKSLNISWDGLVICHGTLTPIGNFQDVNFSEWSDSIATNFIASLEILHKLLPLRKLTLNTSPSVLFFAGGGTNSAPVKYSAYIVSKIALIKMCELLQEEISDTQFSILGPGWVQTKIHQETLQAGPELAGDSFHKTEKMLSGNHKEWVPLSKVVDCCLWALNSPNAGGKNISVQYDSWDSPELEQQMKDDSHLFKLRRLGNANHHHQQIKK